MGHFELRHNLPDDSPVVPYRSQQTVLHRTYNSHNDQYGVALGADGRSVDDGPAGSDLRAHPVHYRPPVHCGRKDDLYDEVDYFDDGDISPRKDQVRHGATGLYESV